MPQKNLRVKSRFEATENISTTARKIEKNTRKMNQSMRRGFRQSQQSALNFKGVLKGILAASVIQKGFGMLSQGVENVTSQFVSFDDAITAAGAKFFLSGKEAKSYEQIMVDIKKAAREAGATTIFNADQAAASLDFLARAGFNSEEAIGSLRSMINLSIATGEDFARAADISSDLLGSFALNAENSTQKIANLNRLNNALVFTANSANVTLEDMFETMKDVGPIATDLLGMNLEKVAAITGVLGDSGIKGTKAMTALRGMFLSLSAPTSGGGKVLQALGIQMEDIATGKPRDVIDVMKDLRTAMDGFKQTEKSKILDAIFGRIPLAGATLFLRNIENIKAFEKRALSAGDISQKTADIMGQSLGNRIKGLSSALTELGFKVLDPFETKIKNSIDALTQFFRGANPQPLIDAFNSVSSAASKTFDIIKEMAAPIPEDVEKRGPVTKALDKFFETYKPGGEKPTFFGGAEVLPDFLKVGGSLDKSFKEGTRRFFDSLIKEIFFTRRDLLTTGGKTLNEIARENVLPTPDIKTPNTTPQVNVNVENQINAKDVEVQTEVKAPGTSGNVGGNKF